MEEAIRARVPAHLWIVGGLGTLWNAFGAFDYFKTRMQDEEYLRSMMPNVDPQAMLAWIDAFPLWAQTGWALGVWMGLAGSLLLLLRSRWAVWALLISFAGAVVGLGYQLMVAAPVPGMEGPMATVMPVVIIIVAAGLFAYARGMEKGGVLR